MASSFLRFLDHTQRRTTVGRTPLDEWSARRRDLYLTTHNTHNRQTSMPPVGFEPTISAGERPQTNALDRAATGTGPTPNVMMIKPRRIRYYDSSAIIWNTHKTWSENHRLKRATGRPGSRWDSSIRPKMYIKYVRCGAIECICVAQCCNKVLGSLRWGNSVT